MSCHVFQTFTFGRLWYETVGARTSATPLIVTYDEGGVTRGIFPACIVPFGPMSLLTWLSAPLLQDYGDALYDQSANLPADAFVREALAMVCRERPRAFLYLTNVREDGVAYPALASDLLVYKRSAGPYVEIPRDFQSYVSFVGATSRVKKVMKRVRRLERAKELGFDMVDASDPQLDDLLTWLFEKKKARYSGRGRRADLYRPGHEEFRRAQAHEEPGVCVSRLMIGGKVAAAGLVCLRNRRAYGLLSGFDPAESASSPGIVRTYLLLKYCSDHDIPVLDLGWGEEPEKYIWTSLDEKLTTFVSNDAKGRLLRRIASTRRAFSNPTASRKGRSRASEGSGSYGETA